MMDQDATQANRAALIARLESLHCEVRDEPGSNGLLILCRGIDRHLPLPRGWESHFTRFFSSRLKLRGSRLSLSYFSSPWHRCIHAAILALFLGERFLVGSDLSPGQTLVALLTAQLVPVAMAHWDLVAIREALRPPFPPSG